jgi:drug/metabolite transporter (DMT)-like permease
VRTLLLMAVAVFAVSLSGPLMAAMVVPPLAIAFWRNAFATLALAPAAVAVPACRAELQQLRGPRLRYVLLAGVALAIHFATWVTALTLTSVASATALVCLQLVWIVLWQLLRGHRFGLSVVTGIVLALSGVLVVSGVDFTVSVEALLGDLLALVGGIAAAAYTVLGSIARRSASTTTYTFVCYGSCATLLAGACLVAGQDLGGYPLSQWGLLLLVTATAQLLGHSVLNHLLATSSPMAVSLALLLEVPGAAILAALILGQQPPAAALLGLAVMLVGMALVIVGNRGQAVEQLTEPPPD